jgi:hypothetical protein
LQNEYDLLSGLLTATRYSLKESLMKRLVCLLFLIANLAYADGRQVDEFQWEGVERVVAIGDIHGDYDNYMATLKAAGLVDKRGKWAGGKTHLVQTGDIPDRGPDTKKIIEHIDKLAKQAKRKGGRVHSLIGNHEAMNVYGDLRYVHEGEFAAFKTRNSGKLRDRVFEITMQNLEADDPEEFANLPGNFREEWNLEHPLGWIEHRQAWDPAWNPDASYAKWVLDKKVAIRVNDSLFLHGGISGFYCRNSLDSITRMVHEKLEKFDPGNAGVLDDEFGPLWYRGLSGESPHAESATIDAILERHGAKRIIVGHTPTSGVVWPRYDSRVIVVDTGISAAYGGHIGYLEITPDGLFAGYPKGKLPLPPTDAESIDYLKEVMAMAPDNPHLKARLKRLQNPEVPAEAEQQASGAEAGADVEAVAEEKQVPVCGITR